MTELAFARLRTIVRLGEAVPDIPIASAVDFILPVNCRRTTAAPPTTRRQPLTADSTTSCSYPPPKGSDYIDRLCRGANGLFARTNFIPAVAEYVRLREEDGPQPLLPCASDALQSAEELFHDELRRSGRATGCGGYGTLFPFVGPPRCVCTLCEYSPAAVWSFLIGGVGLLAGLPGADLLVDAGALWILLGQVNLYRRVNELHGESGPLWTKDEALLEPPGSSLYAAPARDLSEGRYILTGNLTSSLFADDCRFVDPNNAVDGLSRYRQALGFLFEPTRSQLDNVHVRVVAAGSGRATIEATYVASGELKLPWRPKISPWSGKISYDVSPVTGLVVAQTDVWNITRFDAIRQTFTPGSTSRR
ncbi:hypothetical protein EMIHUDRAFT_461024 [Emiliania huxleyi CCMP1516]|uniref:Uncharacterized protein n=2 Tax=Emiliania huxleyi TaxID=2903 RepID=A0A0D3L1K5_EMIH1|nr:hypothetical protein EMIHUDRAFT_461024 [Emiliania huxleyi CCMP1516]EOD41890.1 hypothetical protein EMIHUDRAFT_461024 [Emiliania huxleyi CCMP1516]|eukprot:XP_005794319.1 hypothetical protein EMIHUDRAFT_461024 [Emiliania huxleyi CCMP1516]